MERVGGHFGGILFDTGKEQETAATTHSNGGRYMQVCMRIRGPLSKEDVHDIFRTCNLTDGSKDQASFVQLRYGVMEETCGLGICTIARQA